MISLVALLLLLNLAAFAVLYPETWSLPGGGSYYVYSQTMKEWDPASLDKDIQQRKADHWEVFRVDVTVVFRAVSVDTN